MKLLLMGLLLLPCFVLLAQDHFYDEPLLDSSFQEKAPSLATTRTLKEKLMIGVGGAASFHLNYNYWSITPLIGYRFSQRWLTGLQFSYARLQEALNLQQRFTAWGVTTFINFFLAENLFLQPEYQYSVWMLQDTRTGKSRYTFGVPFIGIGYAIPMGRRLRIIGLVKYTISDLSNPRNPYRNTPLQYSIFFQF
ncbi:MAG: hypothetical protein NZM38_07800 [Cytophagales bacterium]|nr:hypothetical protein [Cytophagales bacterium]MDW8384660.1 hypothetical protein [Flammeovirgaceae bacterium]